MAQHAPGDDPADFLKNLAARDGAEAAPPAADPDPQTIDVKCPCGKTLRVKARLAGKTVKCPACETKLTVPLRDVAPAAPPAAIAIDVAAAESKTNSIRSSRKKQTPLRWLLIGGAVLAIVVPLVYFLAFHKTSKKTKPADTSLAAKSNSADEAADSGQNDDDPPAEADAVKPELGKVADSTTTRKTDWQSVLPEKKPADPPKVVVTQPAKKSPTPADVAKTDKKAATPAKPAAVVSAESFDWIVGKGRTITLHTGDVYEDVEVASVRQGPKPQSLHSLNLKRPTGKAARQKKRPPSPLYGRLIHKIETPDGLLTLKYDKKLKMAVVEQVATQQQLAAERARQRAEIEARLRPTGHRLWPELSKEDHAKAVAEDKEFLITVGKQFADRAMKFRETTYFLFYTNLPEAEVSLISKRLDAMYDQLCTAFGIPRRKNIWRGKCVIVAFIHPQDFQKFEAEIMRTPASAAVQGRAHQYPTGRCVIGCYRGTQFDNFAQVLVHETSHGFLHRHISSVDIPTWINEGIADWIADKVVPVAEHIRRNQAQAVARLRTTRTLGGDFFSGDSIDAWQYGVASHLTEFMLRGGNGPKYRGFIDDIKKGYTWRQSLKRNYGVDENGLTTLYGKSLRIVNLVP